MARRRAGELAGPGAEAEVVIDIFTHEGDGRDTLDEHVHRKAAFVTRRGGRS